MFKILIFLELPLKLKFYLFELKLRTYFITRLGYSLQKLLTILT